MMRMRCEGDDKQTTLYILIPYFTTGFTRSGRCGMIACLTLTLGVDLCMGFGIRSHSVIPRERGKCSGKIF